MNIESIIIAGLLGAAHAAQGYPPPPPQYYYARPQYVPRQPYMSYQDQQMWRRAILEQAKRYCNTFPDDPICTGQEPPR